MPKQESNLSAAELGQLSSDAAALLKATAEVFTVKACCPDCSGSGFNKKQEFCPACRGSGVIQADPKNAEDCGKCEGLGRNEDTGAHCPRCCATGKVVKKKS